MAELPLKDEKLLVSRLRQSEIKAFDALFYHYHQKLYRFAFALLKNEEDAKEIVQEAFCRIWQKRIAIEPDKSFKSYIFTISYNLIIDRLRIRLKDLEYRKFLEGWFGKNFVMPVHSLDYDTLEKVVSGAVEELPEKRRRIYRLSREEGLSHKEIAAQMNIAVKTVENQITLALRHIKSKLGDDILAMMLFAALFG